MCSLGIKLTTFALLVDHTHAYFRRDIFLNNSKKEAFILLLVLKIGSRHYLLFIYFALLILILTEEKVKEAHQTFVVAVSSIMKKII